MELNRVTEKPKRVRYSSHSDPRYLRLLESSRAWKERNKHKASYKKKKAASDLRWYLEARNKKEFLDKRLALQRAYLSKKKIREKDRERIKEFRKAHPEKVRAYGILHYSLRTGKIQKPYKCQRCGTIPKPRIDGRSRLQAHHHDYSKPLDVKWLCSLCHAAINRRYK